MFKSVIAAGSEKVSSQYFGSETSPLEVNSYRIPEIMGLRGYISVTNDGCIPVAEALYGTIGSSKYLQITVISLAYLVFLFFLFFLAFVYLLINLSELDLIYLVNFRLCFIRKTKGYLFAS